MIPSLDTVSAFLLRFDTVFNTVPQHQQEAFPRLRRKNI